ncbi:hypothetical protein HYE31_01980 [Mycoplasmopsis bovis]|nr:hypothetical protein HYE31_01980 [Mycoplasmopsis bovis]
MKRNIPIPLDHIGIHLNERSNGSKTRHKKDIMNHKKDRVEVPTLASIKLKEKKQADPEALITGASTSPISDPRQKNNISSKAEASQSHSNKFPGTISKKPKKRPATGGEKPGKAQERRKPPTARHRKSTRIKINHKIHQTISNKENETTSQRSGKDQKTNKNRQKRKNKTKRRRHTRKQTKWSENKKNQKHRKSRPSNSRQTDHGNV